MSDMIQMKILNARAVQNALNAFEKKIAKKVVRQGVRASWAPLKDRAKENAKALSNDGERQPGRPKMSALIAKNIQLRAFKKQRKGQYGMLVRIKANVPEFVQYSMGSAFSITGKRKQVSGSRYYIPAAIEYGHDNVPAKSFMRKALDVTLPKAPAIFKQHLVRAIREENQKK